ncbi:MAG TPA: hypothetical protein VFE36_00185 [Candidatus Baltobacteraceae bacterium]|nr:hypothetical protein [Candidatus Baltobacteraceae bacterium]
MTGIAPWDELLEEFRALGGVADNVRHGVDPHGPGISPSIPLAKSRCTLRRTFSCCPKIFLSATGSSSFGLNPH